MANQDFRNDKYKKHIQAIEEHKALLEKLHQPDSSIHLDEIKFSLENLTITLEEYFKVIGIP